MNDYDKKVSGPPAKLFAEVSVRSKGGTSIFAAPKVPTSENIEQFYASEEDLNLAEEKLLALGFEVLGRSQVGLSIAGPIPLYEKVFGTQIYAEERMLHVEDKSGSPVSTTCYNAANESRLTGYISADNSDLGQLIEGVAISEPMQYFASPLPPRKDYWHLNVPGDVSMALNADRAHRRGYTGRGVKVVMVDSGWYRHSYFTSRGYSSTTAVLGPGASNPTRDENGHGTGESANVFAAAPDVTFQMVKMSFTSSIGAFNRAVALRPDIITCSWGKSIQSNLSSADIMLGAAIASAVRSGIIVVFSAGNGHYGFPGQHPDVISAGGAFLSATGQLMASNYASGFKSRIYSGRLVPDVSGLVGMRPGAKYIMLPVEAGDQLDRDLAGGNHPNGDETRTNDGWAAFSGTSAAAPQIAGICALLKQANPRLTPRLAKHILSKTAKDVIQGVNAMNEQARTGYDLATGHGLVDAAKAATLARSYYLISKIVIKKPLLPIPIVPPTIPNGKLEYSVNDSTTMDQNSYQEMDISLVEEIEEMIAEFN